MPSRQETVLRYIRRLASAPETEPVSDADLLDRFIAERDQRAFTALVQRHGAMVLQVCRWVVGNADDAEDAFQGTFLVLARKAATVQPREALAAWLHGVARRVALKTRAARLRRHEAGPLPGVPADGRADPLDELSARELLAIVDEEVQRLPQRYRLPLITCCLGGRTVEEAARQLGWTPGSVKGRLERGRARLHDRLVRRGLTLSAALAAAEASRATASALVLSNLVVRTVPGALAFGASREMVTGVSTSAAAAAGRVVKAMALARLGTAAALLLTTAAVGAGVALRHNSTNPASQTQDAAPRADFAAGQKPLQRSHDDAFVQLQTLAMDHARARADLHKPVQDAPTLEEQDKILLKDNIAEKTGELNADYARRFLEVAGKHPEERKVVVYALAWVVRNARNTPDEAGAVDMLIRDHLNDKDKEIDALLQGMIFTVTGPGEKLLRAAAETIEDKERKILARYCLAQNLKNRFEAANGLKAWDAKTRRHFALFNGSDHLDRLAAGDSAKLLNEAEHLFDGLAKDGGGVRIRNQTVKELAEKELYDIRTLSVGKPAPEIEGEDIDGKRFKLSEYRGKVVVLDFWVHSRVLCRDMYPYERSLVKRLADKPFVLLGVNSDKDREELKKTIKQERITWRSWWDGGNAPGPITKKWNVRGFPTVYVLDAQGVIRFKYVRIDMMGGAVDALLKEREGGQGRAAWGWESSATRWWASIWQTANRWTGRPARSPD